MERNKSNIGKEGKTENRKENETKRTRTNFPKKVAKAPLLSVVIPLYNEEKSIPELGSNLEVVLERISRGSYEVIFVDDGSTDNSRNEIRKLNQKNPRFHCISFRRNYGKSAALSVGFKAAKGKYVITMDADLQDDPEEIPNLLKKLNEGYDLVSGWKRQRFDPITKVIASRIFNFVTSIVSGIRLHDFNCGLKAYRNAVVKRLDVYGEMHRYLPVLAYWDGFSVTEIPVKHHPRKFGKTKFGAGRFLKGFLDLLTVIVVTRFMQRPLHFFGGIGTLMLLLGFFINLYLIIEWLMGKTYLSNRPLLLFGILLIIFGAQIISIGLLGEMNVKTISERIKYNIKERF